MIKMATTSNCSFTHLLCISYMLFAVCSLTIRVIDARSVPDGYVYTDQHRTARKGDQLELSCDFYGTPVGVFWKKGDNPEKSPDLITDVDGEPPSGSCVADQSCRLEADYTLVIDEVKVADQGTYICRVSNYRGVLIHNFTEVTVYAPPMEPFPVIKECPMKDSNDTQQTCSLSTSENVNITCSASGYYPDIDLFFLHGSRKMVSTHSEEVTNLDGTKDKSISTSAEPSGIPYVCVASDIPGSQDQRTVSIEVNYLEVIINATTLTPSQTSVPRNNVTNIVVPVVIFIILMLGLLCAGYKAYRWHEKKLKRLKDDPETMPLNDPKVAGEISFYELWYLVQNMDDWKKLEDALHDLGISTDNVPSRNKAYELLCDWKDTDTSDNQRRRLYNTLNGYGLDGLWKRMNERRTGEERVVISDWCLEHIVQQIGNETDFGKFFGELTSSQELASTGNRDEYIEEAMNQLKLWRGRIREVNHFVLISLALERAKCKPLDRTFFKIPEHLLDPISSQEVKGFVYGLTGRHCRRIAEAVKIKDEQKILTIINENNEELFDTQAMITEWIAEQECSNYEKRCKLDDAVIKIGRHDLTDSFGTTTYRFEAGEALEAPHLGYKFFNFSSIFDDDLVILLKHLPPRAIPLFLEKLGITIADEDSTDMIEEKLRRWRDESITERRSIPLQKLCLLLRDVLKETKCDKGHIVKDDELENILESITSSKVLERLTASLGVTSDKECSHIHGLKKWRDTCAVEKCRKMLREKCDALGLSGCVLHLLPQRHVFEVEMVRFAYNIVSYDIEPLATLLGFNTGLVKKVRAPLKGTVGLLIKLLNKSLDSSRRNSFPSALRDIGYMDVARSAYFGYGASLSELFNLTSGLLKEELQILIKHLQIDIRALTTAEQQDTIKVMKAWKNQLRQEPIHFRLKLALPLQAAGKRETADDIISGRYRTTEVCSNVVKNICDGLDDHQREELCKHLNLKSRKDEGNQTSKLVTEWVRNWLNKLGKLSFEAILAIDKFSPRVKEIDELFRAGFFELAEEIMLLGVSKLSSAQPANKEPDEISNEGEEAQLDADSVGSLQTSGEDQSQANRTAEQLCHISSPEGR